MNTKDFKYFLTVYQYKSFSKAAEALYIAQPALSRYISNLEDSLNVKLFDRKQTPLCLTPAGVQFLKYAKTVQDLEHQLMEDFSLINQNSGHVSLGVPPLLGEYIVPKILPVLRRTLPGISTDIIMRNTEPLKKQLLSGEIDLAILSSPIQSSDLETFTLMKDPFYLVTNRNHPIAHSADRGFGTISQPLPVVLQQFQNDPFLLLQPEKQFYKTVMNVFDYYGFKPIDMILVPTMSIAMELVSSGMGISFGLRSMLSRSQHDYYFCMLPDQNYLPVTIAFSKNTASMNASISKVFTCLCNVFQNNNSSLQL